MSRSRHALPAGAILAVALALVSCAVNPATGKRQFVLVSEGQELAMGRENDQQVVQQMGLYDDPALQDYVARIGQRLAALSERPTLEWTFRVVDDPVVNAFALPGGYIYITRGILAHFNNEAELASVLGHEIGHVTARHSVSQMSKAQLTQFGLGVGYAVGGERMQALGGLVETGLGLMTLRFSRDDEKQADELGLRYITRADYDPRPMPAVFETLRRVSESAGAERIPGWMSTHPLPENRSERIHADIARMGRDFSGSTVNRDGYLEQIDNIVYGQDPRQGYFKDELFLHPEMEFRFEFPEGWRTQNSLTSVAGLSAQEDALIQLTVARRDSPASALDAFFEQEGVSRAGGWRGQVHGLPNAGSEFLLSTESGAARGLVVCVEHGGRIFQLIGFSSQQNWSTYQSVVARSLSSFDRLTDRRALEVQAKRLRAIRVGSSSTLQAFAKRYDATVPVETLALLNGLEVGSTLEPGGVYKVVVGGELP